MSSGPATTATISTTTSSLPPLVFPVLSEDKDFIISNFVEDEKTAGSSGAGEELELPFGNIPRGERIGRIADWTGISAEAAQQRGNRRQAAITNTAAKLEEEEEGWSFSLGHASALTTGARRVAPAKATRAQPAATGPAARAGGLQQRDARSGPRRYGSSWARPVDRIREPSIKVGTEWKLVEEIEFSRLAKVQINVEEPEILSTFGSVSSYDRSYDKLKAKAEKPFTGSVGSVPAPASASDDAYLQECASQQKATIFTTETVAGLLMACQRTVQPWDIIVKRRGQSVFFDVRPDSRIHLVNVNETAGESAPEDASDAINSQFNLAMEATKINLALSEVLGKGQEQVSFDKEAVPAIGKAYRYSKYSLGGDDFSMIVRSEVCNALGQDTVISKAFLEYDPASFNWRQKLDVSRGAVLAHEIKNNSATLSRWVYQAICSGSTALKLAYVSRVSAKSPSRHVILGVHDFDPFDLATQMSLNVANGFGIIRALADLCLSQPDNADYALVRDANKPMLRLYALPQ